MPSKNQKMSVCQIDKNGKLNLCGCGFGGFYGTYILYLINDSYKKIVNSSPILSLSDNFFGELIAINIYIQYGETAYWQGLNINIIIHAIRALVHQNKITKEETLSEPKKLSPTEMHVLYYYCLCQSLIFFFLRILEGAHDQIFFSIIFILLYLCLFYLINKILSINM